MRRSPSIPRYYQRTPPTTPEYKTRPGNPCHQPRAAAAPACHPLSLAPSPLIRAALIRAGSARVADRDAAGRNRGAPARLWAGCRPPQAWLRAASQIPTVRRVQIRAAARAGCGGALSCVRMRPAPAADGGVRSAATGRLHRQGRALGRPAWLCPLASPALGHNRPARIPAKPGALGPPGAVPETQSLAFR
jgi:hypothetical protein